MKALIIGFLLSQATIALGRSVQFYDYQCPKGDVTRDGEINSDDALITMNVAGGNIEVISKYFRQLNDMDINSDGYITSEDGKIFLAFAGATPDFLKKLKCTPKCNPKNHPAPHWKLVGDTCTPSCGAAGSLVKKVAQARSACLPNEAKIPAYDVSNCCVPK
jgi:hypothetical protein